MENNEDKSKPEVVNITSSKPSSCNMGQENGSTSKQKHYSNQIDLKMSDIEKI